MDGVCKMKKEVPEHFGSGENIEVMGDQTENFDICGSAVMLFEELNSAEQDETKELVKQAAKSLDEMFGIEKKVVESGKASSEDVSTAAELINDFFMKIGAISEKMEQDYKDKTGFVKTHLEEIVKRLDKGDVEELSEAWSKKERGKRKNKCDNPRGFTMKQFCKNQKSRSKKGEKKNESLSRCDMKKIIREELEIAFVNEKDDRCTRIAKRKYDAWPSAYASGAVVQCRRGKIWKVLKETDINLDENTEYEQLMALEEDEGLRKWFGRKGEPGKKGGWVDCNTCRKDKKTGKKKCKACGRQKGEKRAKYPRCRPTPSQCKGYKRRGSNLQKEEVIEEIEYNYIPASDATYDDGNPIDFLLEFWDDVVVEAEYRGRKVTLNKPTRGDVKKFKVYVKDPKTGNVKKVNFGDPNMRIKKSNPKRRKSFRARHNCDNPGPKTKARYWSCRKW